MNMFCHVWLATLTLATTAATPLTAADVAKLRSRRHKTTLATTWGVWDPPFFGFFLLFTRSHGVAHAIAAGASAGVISRSKHSQAIQ